MASLINTSVLDKKAEEQRQNKLNQEKARRDLCLSYLGQLQKYQTRLGDILDTFQEMNERCLRHTVEIEGLSVTTKYRGGDCNGFAVKSGTGGVMYAPKINTICGWSNACGMFESYTFDCTTTNVDEIRQLLEKKMIDSSVSYQSTLLKLIEQIGAYTERMEEYLKSLYA